MRKKKKYVVGFNDDQQCVYGKNKAGEDCMWVDPMTIFDAKREMKKLKGKPTPVIYKLVPVKV